MGAHTLHVYTPVGPLKMKWLVAVFAASIFVVDVYCADDTIPWCYHDPTCNDTTWPRIAANFCNRSRQSPINIDTRLVSVNTSLNDFVFINYDNPSILDNITNTGKTVKVNFKRGVQISGGGLSEPYDGLQFHLHWGNLSNVPGAEHAVDGVRAPMELHIVHLKSRFEGNTTLAVADPTGLAALGFRIEVLPDTTGQPASWNTLTNYLRNITLSGDIVNVTEGLSLNDLLVGVDRTEYYRYLGSLTTPNCHEAVVWTVFKDTIKISADLIDKFSTMLHINNTIESPIMVNVFRQVQPALSVTTRANEPETDDAPQSLVSLGLLALCLVLGRSY
ncbi:carbonic anhydrase 4-like [Syngnathoides biaculeatus]|uniref:carbonic anhydrase 4-like n=1 Tax=Syngnathoides biaculeatus TaxID=300417 RepID=UPI002ADD78FB|nr:carbonic anhydrase 4-like [Syngnathoides biaculeatus]